MRNGIQAELHVRTQDRELLADDGTRNLHAPPASGTHVRHLRLRPAEDLVRRNRRCCAPLATSHGSPPTILGPTSSTRRRRCRCRSLPSPERHQIASQFTFKNCSQMPQIPLSEPRLSVLNWYRLGNKTELERWIVGLRSVDLLDRMRNGCFIAQIGGCHDEMVAFHRHLHDYASVNMALDICRWWRMECFQVDMHNILLLCMKMPLPSLWIWG